MSSRLLRLAVLAAPLALAACGDGWEMVRTTQFPYGNERTAGTGVAYVRAKMLPKKEVRVEETVTTPAPLAEPAAAEKVFHDKQSK